MNVAATPRILISYPREFICYGKFERKVATLLSRLSFYEIACINDWNSHAKKFLSNIHQADSEPLLINADDLAGITHAIIFDDPRKESDLITLAKSANAKIRVIETNLTTVANVDKGEAHDVYIGRGSIWGNPYAIGFDGDRDEVIRKYRYDFDRGFLKFSKEDALELKGKALGCHCKPAACHGDVIAEYINSLDDGL
jgi:hypothetical protein